MDGAVWFRAAWDWFIGCVKNWGIMPLGSLSHYVLEFLDAAKILSGDFREASAQKDCLLEIHALPLFCFFA